MKKYILQKWLLLALIFLFNNSSVNAQCGAGYTRDTLNWDYLDFLLSNGFYSSAVSLAQSQNQRFTFGTQVVTITNNFAAASTVGDDNTFTAKTGSYGNGADLRFKGNGAVTFTFQNPVQNVKFSIYDVDKSQRAAVSALNGVAGANVTLSTLAGTILTLGTNGTPNATATANSNVVANTDNAPLANGTVNVDISGPVTSITITTTNTGTSGGAGGEDGSFYVSDISGCSTGTFPVGYYAIAKPYTRQPAYYLAVCNNTVYYVNVANGVARKLFTDAAHTNINSLAYDPYRHMVYYSFSLSSSPSTDKTIKRYDYDMDTIGVFIPNVNTIGIPTYESGVESGAAAFYNNSLYLGIEGTNMGDDKTNRESIVWKIDFTPTFGPASNVSQVYAVPADDGNGTGLHDWGDIGINDGILYDFDGASGQTDFYHKNLLTGSVINIDPSPATLVPRQVSVDWQGQMYNSGSPSASSTGTEVPYNGNGTVDNTRLYTMRYQGVAITGSWGDAAEAFKPKTDYGDAPASYDPVGVDPGTHEKNDSIYLGSAKAGIEWVKKTSANATGDGAEEDGVSGLQVIATGVSNFTVPVKVYNNTNRNATVVGWVDANGNGTFEASEGTTYTVTPSAAAQNISLLWVNINTTLPAYATTFMRIRITTADQGMTTADMNGYFDNGEIEDYTVAVSLLLPEQHVTLKAQKLNSNKVSLVWNLNQENNNTAYELQRSTEGLAWETINNRETAGGTSPATYSYIDSDPLLPTSYYKVKIVKHSGSVEYSDVKKVDFATENSISLSPNPAKNKAVLKIESAIAGIARINILDYNGRSVYDANSKLTRGTNEIDLVAVKNLSSGMYKVRVKINEEIFVTTLVVMK